MALLRYAVADVLRSRRRTLTAILGVLLAVTFIAGTFIAIDSSTRATLDGILANYPTDIQFQASPDNATQMREAVEAISGIVRVATWRNAQFDEIESTSVGASAYAQVVGIEPDRLPSFLDGLTITAGSLSLPRGTVALSDDLASQVNVTLGGTATFAYRSYNITGNETVARFNVTVGALFRPPSGTGGPIGVPFYSPATALVGIGDVSWYEQQLGIPFSSNFMAGEIQINRDRLLDPYDLPASQRNLARLDRQINDVLAPFQGYVTIDYVGNAISNFATVITIQRIIYLALSTPVLLLGIYLGAIGVDLGHAERRRELAVLKTRGATPRQLVGLLLVEAALGGAIAAIVGLLAGVGLSRLLLSFVSPTFSASTSPRYDVVVLTPSTVVIVTILSVVFMAITSIRSARRTARVPIVETLRYYAPGETRIQYRPWVDILLITLAVVTYGMALYARSNPQDFFTFLIGALFFIFLPFTPIFLIVGTTRLLTRSTGRVYEWTARVCKPFAKNLYYVISRNLRRNPRRSANVAVIIALGIAFGMFILVTFSSQLAYQERQARATVGADLALDAPTSNATFAADLSAVPEVAGVTRVQSVPVSPRYCCANVYALDPATFFAVTNPEPWYFGAGGGAEAARQVLATPGRVLVTETYLRNAYLAVGDALRFEGSVFNGTTYNTVTVNTTIGGTVRGLPGTIYYGFGMPQTIYGSLDTMGPLLAGEPYRGYGADRFLIALRANADWRSAKTHIVALGASNVQVAAEQVEQLRSNPVFRAFFGFIELEMAFMVVILTAGLGVILYAATLERDVELAAIRARGASGWQTAGLLIGEAASIMLIGLIVGTGIGILAAYLSTTFIAAGPGSGGESLVPMLFVLPMEALLLLVLAPAAMLLTSFAVTVRIARMDIARVLKLRGG